MLPQQVVTDVVSPRVLHAEDGAVAVDLVQGHELLVHGLQLLYGVDAEAKHVATRTLAALHHEGPAELAFPYPNLQSVRQKRSKVEPQH